MRSSVVIGAICILSMFNRVFAAADLIPVDKYVGEDARFTWQSDNYLEFKFGISNAAQDDIIVNGVLITCVRGSLGSTPNTTEGFYKGRLYFYGDPSPSADFKHFEITRVTVLDEKAYLVAIMDPTSYKFTALRAWNLVIREAPAFNPPLNGSHDVAEDKDFSITCSASGRPVPNVTWGNKTSGSPVAHGTGSATLSLLKIQRHQAGVYQCQAINDARRGAITQDITINVQYPAFIYKTNSSSERTGGWVGYDVSLICVTGGYPTPTVTWSNATGHVLHEEVNLTSKYVFKVKDGDFGNYTCKATNKMGGNDSLVINLYKSENTPPPTTTAPGPPTNAPRTSGTHPGVIAGAVIACVLAVAVVIVALIVWRRKKRPGSSGPKTRSQPNHYDTEGQEQYAIPDRPSAHDQRSSAADELPQYAQVNKEAKKKKPPPGGLIYAELDHTDYPDSRETLTRPSREPQQETDYAVVVGGMRQDPEPQYGNLASEGYNMASEV